MIYLGRGGMELRQAPQAHMFLWLCFMDEHDSQNEDPKIKPHKDLESLSRAIFELENIPYKSVVSVCLLSPLPYHLRVSLAALSDTDTPTRGPPLKTFPCQPEGG